MNKVRSLVLSALAGVMSVSAYAAPERVGDFSLLDQKGDFHQLSRYGHRDAVVIFSHTNECASADSMLSKLQSLRSKYEGNVEFFLMDSSVDADLADIRDGVLSRETSLPVPVLLDDTQLVAESLNLSNVGEVVVLDPRKFNVLYRGPLGAQVSSTLDKAAQGTVDETVVVQSSGCALTYAAKEAHANAVPEYATEIAPIIEEQCASCHREGGIGPFAMNSHLMLKGWSPMIREVLLTKRMPPMQVDPEIGHFDNARYISEDQLQTLVHWIDEGSPRGDASLGDPLAALEYPSMRDWALGEPDYIVKTPKQEIPATGVLDYINVNVDLPFEGDKWVKAVQFIPGDPSVLHHLLTYVTAPAEDFDGGEADTRSIARRFLEGYAPGKVEAMTFPDETGVFLPDGYQLSMQLHFTTNGKATTDETLLGLYMYDEPPKYENFTRSVSNRFKIPPFARDHETAAAYTFDEEVIVTGLRAHMHFRGKDMKFTAEYPDGSMQDLLSVPNYSYAWQPTYQLDKPALLPAGTKVHVTGAFDNSEFNPANPDPSKELTFGLQSWDEMFIGYWTYHSTEAVN